MQEKWSLRFIRVAAIFGLIGTVLGSHMAGVRITCIPSDSRAYFISRLVVAVCLGRLLQVFIKFERKNSFRFKAGRVLLVQLV